MIIVFKFFVLEGDDVFLICVGVILGVVVRMIVFVDIVMGLDNVIVVVGVVYGNIILVVIGLFVFVFIIVWGSKFILYLMEWFFLFVYGGVVILVYIVGNMIGYEKNLYLFFVVYIFLGIFILYIIIVVVLISGMVVNSFCLIKW